MFNLSLQGDIPKKLAVGVVVAQAIANAAITTAAMRKMAKDANEMIADRDQRLHIFKEGFDFLLERADPMTVAELNKNLDYWRIIRGIEPPSHDEDEK